MEGEEADVVEGEDSILVMIKNNNNNNNNNNNKIYAYLARTLAPSA